LAAVEESVATFEALAGELPEASVAEWRAAAATLDDLREALGEASA
jgi:hypothetical protein